MSGALVVAVWWAPNEPGARGLEVTADLGAAGDGLAVDVQQLGVEFGGRVVHHRGAGGPGGDGQRGIPLLEGVARRQVTRVRGIAVGICRDFCCWRQNAAGKQQVQSNQNLRDKAMQRGRTGIPNVQIILHPTTQEGQRWQRGISQMQAIIRPNSVYVGIH